MTPGDSSEHQKHNGAAESTYRAGHQRAAGDRETGDKTVSCCEPDRTPGGIREHMAKDNGGPLGRTGAGECFGGSEKCFALGSL